MRDLVRSRGLGDVYKRQCRGRPPQPRDCRGAGHQPADGRGAQGPDDGQAGCCLLYTSDAADERSSVDLGGRRIIKKKNLNRLTWAPRM